MAKHKTAKLEIKKVVPQEISTKFTADLTIKGITKEIKVLIYCFLDKNQVTANAEFSVDRSEFNVQYNSASLVDVVKDKVIYDDFDINVTIVAKK